MAGLVSGRTTPKTDATANAAGHVRTAKNAALRTACNVLIPNWPSVAQPWPSANMQNGNTKRPIHAGFRRLAQLAQLAQRILVGVARKARNRRARGGRAERSLRLKSGRQADQAERREGLRVLPVNQARGSIRGHVADRPQPCSIVKLLKR